jgi:UDP-N-acetylglucosamine 2-epimerase (non-hydrolysing)
MRIVNIVGARPNFIKIAPLMKEMRKQADIYPFLVHTGQHYDVRMAGQFFQDLQIPEPDVSLEVGSGSHAYQTAEVMKRLEPILEESRPDLVFVVGDVNSTLAAALTAAKLHIPVAHVEAGLRSFDRTMPEEINRMLTDVISDYLFVTEESGRQNLLREGIDESKIFFVGNVMIDSLEESRHVWERSDIHCRLGVEKGEYGVVTLHRPSNVDNLTTLRGLAQALAEISARLPILFPMHPRTIARIKEFNLEKHFHFLPLHPTPYTLTQHSTLNTLPAPSTQHPVPFPDTDHLTLFRLDPLGYLDFMALMAHARLVLTDSGGLQEETTVLGVPCLTLRENTERPVTVMHGTNRLVGMSPARIAEETFQVLANPRPILSRPPLWDGKTSERIVAVLREHMPNAQHSTPNAQFTPTILIQQH